MVLLLSNSVVKSQMKLPMKDVVEKSTKEATRDEFVAVIPIVNLESKPIVKATLNGRSCYLLVDTGSDISIFNLMEKKKFKFTSTGSVESYLYAKNINGNARTLYYTSNAALHLGGNQILGKFYAANINLLVDSISKKHGIKIAGILGSDVMRLYGIQVDYRNKVLRIGKAIWER